MYRYMIALILFFSFTACVSSYIEYNYDDDLVYRDLVYDDLVYDDLVNDDLIFDDLIFDDFVYDDFVYDDFGYDDFVYDDLVFDNLAYDDLEVIYSVASTHVVESAYIEHTTNPRFKIAIDPGHQGRGNYNREPMGPGATEYKARVATGTRGVSTGIPEYQLVLYVSLKLRDELQSRGFDVFMVRETHDVDISNSERAILASESGADIFVRVHANGSQNRELHGIMTLSSSMNNPFIPHLYEQSRVLSEYILNAMIDTTNARNLGVIEVDNMTGNNWSTIPVTIVEMGFMTNPREDELMQTAEYQQKLVIGMANGIEYYFAEWGDQ